MTVLVATVDGEPQGEPQYDESMTVRVVNPDKENGMPEAGPLSWLNSAMIEADPDHDRVIVSVSIGDPRGALAMEVRRAPDGRILIHLPYPGESFPHVPTAVAHEGTLVVTTETGNRAAPADFSDPEPEPDDDDDEWEEEDDG